jgi:hypothetical protein
MGMKMKMKRMRIRFDGGGKVHCFVADFASTLGALPIPNSETFLFI